MTRPCRRRLIMIAALMLLLVAWYAAAQPVPPPDVDVGKPATWFLSAAGWGFIVFVFINFLKANILKGLHGIATLLVAAGINVGGALLAAAGVLRVFGATLDASLGEAVGFGVTAFVLSVGYYDTAVIVSTKVAQRVNRVVATGGKA